MFGRPIGEQAPAACLPYDPRAQEVARKVAGVINHHLPDVTVEHVGSTTVAGCVGMGVIDLLMPYRKGGLESVKETLKELGFQRQGTRNPFPEDRPVRVGSMRHDGDTFRLARPRGARRLRRTRRASRLPRPATRRP